MNFLRLSDLDLENKRVFIRADLNVPQDDQGAITDDSRIRASLPGIQMALEKGAAVMVTSHLGRPVEGELKPEDSLAPIAKRLEALLGQSVPLIADWVDGGFEVQPGQVVLLENCRANDAFGTSHRAQATTHGIALKADVACAGPLVAAELEALGKALHQPAKPLVAIVGGSKVSTKLTILDALADKVDQLVVGGGIANTFLLAMGLPIGKSLAEPDLVPEARRIIEKMEKRGASVPIPTDVVTAKEFSADATGTVKAAKDVAAEDLILDVGPATAKTLAAIMHKAGTIVWNGPLGVFEFDAFSHGTKVLSEAIAASNAMSIAGGGDTVAAISKFEISKDVGYISTAGGAFLEFLEGKTLPAIEALEQRAKSA